MMLRRTVLMLAVAGEILQVSPVAAQVAYVDSQGREWRQLADTAGRSWSAVAAACPTDGSTPCTGSLGNLNVDGWVWATRAQAQAMLSEFAAAVANGGCVSGALHTDAASEILWRFGSFPIFDTTRMLSGLTSTGAVGAGLSNYVFAPSIQTNDESASDTLICASSLVPRNSSDSACGIWLFRVPPCRGDLDGNGAVDAGDIGSLLLQFGAGTTSAGDLDGSGTVDAGDIGLLLLDFGDCG